MYIVCITAGRQGPGYVDSLATILALSPFDARPHAASPGPRVVAVKAERADAERLVGALSSHGFDSFLLEESELQSLDAIFRVRSIRLQPELLLAVHRDGRTIECSYRDVRYLLKGTIASGRSETTKTTTKKIALGRAIATSGLVMTKKVEKTTTFESKSREGFLLVHTGHLELLFLENETLYEDLARQEPTRAAGFLRLVSELRTRASYARYDERLQTRPGQAQILGSLFSPEEDLNVAIACVMRALSSG